MNLTDFLNSNFFQTLVTLIVGIVAYIIYLNQRRDTKKDAANSLLLEIQHAERSIARVNEYARRGTLDIDLEILQVNSWTNHKHLFSRDFDKDEWDAITEFYSKAHLLDEAIKYNNKGFSGDVDQIRANKQRVLADLTKDTVDKMSTTNIDPKDVLQEFTSKAELFDQLYMEKQGIYAYNPNKPLNDAKGYLEDLKPLSTTSVGTKLKKLAGSK